MFKKSSISNNYTKKIAVGFLMRFLCGTHSLYSLSSNTTKAGSILVSLTSQQPEPTKNLYTDKGRVWINQAFANYLF